MQFYWPRVHKNCNFSTKPQASAIQLVYNVLANSYLNAMNVYTYLNTDGYSFTVYLSNYEYIKIFKKKLKKYQIYVI